MKYFHVSTLFAMALLVLALFPAVGRWRETSRMTERLGGLNVVQERGEDGCSFCPIRRCVLRTESRSRLAGSG